MMSWLTRIKNALHSRQLDEDLSDEMLDHVERRTVDLETQGLGRAEARRRALLVFGNMAVLREQSREVKLWASLEATGQDLRYALRGLRRNPVFAVTTIVLLSLAIGANTAIYSILDAALLRPLPLLQPEKLFRLTTSGSDSLFSYVLFGQLREAAGSAAQIALFDSPNRTDMQAFGADQGYEEGIQQTVSPDAFEMLGVRPALGRLFSSSEDHFPGPRPVVVLSHDYWQRRFGGDGGVIGKGLVVDGRPYSIIGVAGQGFFGIEPGKFVDVWLPVTAGDPSVLTNPSIRIFRALGRLAPGISREQLAARLQSAFHRHQETMIGGANELPATAQKALREMTLQARPGGTGVSDFRETFSKPLWILLGVSACILLIACAGVASLLLARSTARAGEVALRISLGARRARLIRQLMTESLLISVAASLCGWAMAGLAAPALVRIVSTKANAVRLDLTVDYRVLLFCAAICGLSALFFGLLPAWQATGTGPALALRGASGQAGRLRMGRLFVGIQVAFAFCLVTCGAGFMYSLRNLTAVKPGFDSRGVTVLSIINTPQRDRQLTYMQQLQMHTAALPNVQGAATGWMAILSTGRRAQKVVLPGKAQSEQEETFYRVSPGYFAALHTPLLRGRDFSFGDNDDEPVATVVNLAFARRYFGGDSVLGREFRRDDGVRHQIIGLAADSHFGSLRSGPEPIAYMPMKPPRAFTMYVRSGLDAATVGKVVEREAQRLGPGLRVRDVTTVDALVGNTMLRDRLLASVGGVFAFVGLLLAGVGLFGLLNYSVTRRTKEIGIRTALGAQTLPIYNLVLKDLAAMIGGGLLVGLGGSIALLRLMQSLMFGVQTADARVFGTAVAIFLGVAVIAGGLPARRAAAIDPTVALRHD